MSEGIEMPEGELKNRNATATGQVHFVVRGSDLIQIMDRSNFMKKPSPEYFVVACSDIHGDLC